MVKEGFFLQSFFFINNSYCTKIDTSSSSTAQPSGGLSNSDLGNDIIVCKCGCDDFLVDLFKKGYCNRCSHKH